MFKAGLWERCNAGDTHPCRGNHNRFIKIKKHINGLGQRRVRATDGKFLRRVLMTGMCTPGASVFFILVYLVEKEMVLSNCGKEVNLRTENTQTIKGR